MKSIAKENFSSIAGPRLAEERDRLGLTQAQAADLCGVSREMWGRYEKGSSAPGGEVFANFAIAGGDANYLLTGQRGKSEIDFAFDLAHSSTEIGPDEFALVPVYDVEASAGPGSVVDHETPSHQIAFRRDWLRSEGLHARTLAALTARGDSMSPTIAPGALLLIDTAQAQPRREGVYVLQADGHLRVKRISPRADGALLLTSDNPLYPPEQVGPDLVPRLHVVGLVVLVSQRID